MKNFKKYSLLFIVLWHGITALGQISTSAPQLTMPLPSVQSLANYADIPVNTFNGVPDISIPLYTFPTHSKDINAPLTLNYHPAGLSLLQPSSDVGTGWSLMADCVVSRTVVNEPDEYYKTHNYDAQFLDLEFDDLYSVNLFGESARFKIIRDTSNDSFKVQMMDISTLKIEFSMDPETYIVNSFTIYDDKGYKYVFDQQDIGTCNFLAHSYIHYVAHRVTVSCVSAIHLTRVIDNNDKTLIRCGYTLYERPNLYVPNFNDSALKLTQLESVDFGKAVFNYTYTNLLNSAGSDPVELNDITIKDLHENVIKKYVLEHTFTELLELPRRYLTLVKEYDKDLVISKNYELKYKSDYVNPYSCDEDYEFGMDVYGFLNLKPIYGNSGGLNYFSDLVDVTVPDVCEVGVLEKMILPTGGVVKYDFESNTYRWEYSDATSTEDEYYRVNCFDNLTTMTYAQNSFSPTSFNTAGTTATWSFNVTGNTTKKLFFKIDSTPYSSALFGDGTTLTNPTFSISGTNYNYNFSNTGTDENRYACLGKLLELAPGTYVITISKLPGTGTSGNITISEKVRNPTLKRWNYGGGLRIKRITQLETPFATEALKEIDYEYRMFDDVNRSSGEIYDGYTEVVLDNGKIVNPQVGYRNVKVYNYGNNENNGYTKYYYKMGQPTDYDPVNNYYPYFLSYKEGLLEKTEVYDKSGKIVSDEETTYSFENVGDSFQVNPNVLNLGGIMTHLSWVKPEHILSKFYFYNGANNQTHLETYKSFTYNALNREVEEENITNSLNQVVKTRYNYHSGNSPFSRNRISELESIQQFKEGNLIASTKINYATTWAGNQSFLPKTVSASKGNQSLDNRLNYELYDEYGNILQLSQQDGTSICYIWGYNNTMPIAKIENGKYNLIDANLIEHAKLASNSNDGASELITRLQNIRNALPNAMVTTYTYVPLVGLATVTDPRGYTTTYDYDSFGRLAKVFDAAGNQLSTNEYHFRTQN